MFLFQFHLTGLIVVVRSGVFTAANTKVPTFLNIAPCCLMAVDPRFGCVYYIHLQGNDCADHRPDAGSSDHFRNVGIRLRDNALQELKRMVPIYCFYLKNSSYKFSTYLLYECWYRCQGRIV